MLNNFKFKAVIYLQLDIFSKHVRFVCHYTVFHFLGDAAIRRYFGQLMLVTVLPNLPHSGNCRF